MIVGILLKLNFLNCNDVKKFGCVFCNIGFKVFMMIDEVVVFK